MAKKLSQGNGYKQLVLKIKKELTALEVLIKGRALQSYWNVGKYISEDLLKNQSHSGYGENLYRRLSNNLPLSDRTLKRTVQFYRTYPIRPPATELQWTHYIHLLSIEGKSQRKGLQQMAINKDWCPTELKNYISELKQKQTQQNRPKEIPLLSFTRGRLNTYKIVASEEEETMPLLVDLGFQMRKTLPQVNKLGIMAGETIEVIKGKIKKATIEPEQLYTYKAYVEEVIDGDTLWVLIDTDFGMLIRQKLRLRGIDCPELSTERGQRAKKFVQNELKNCDFIIIKTHKDKVDKYDRYITDIFYMRDKDNAQVVLKEGNFLNQELLDNHLAIAL